MNTELYGLLAETSIHAGSGQSTGYVDLPFNREAATDYPVIAGSGIKGALRDMARRALGPDPGEAAPEPNKAAYKDNKARIDTVFGKQESAGALDVSTAFQRWPN